MKTVIGAGEFKATCLKLIDEVARTGEALVITKHGKAVARLVPMPPSMGVFGALAGSVVHEGDIVSPLESEWEACR